MLRLLLHPIILYEFWYNLFMKSFILLFSYMISCAAQAQVSGVVDVIRDPKVSRRCKALISARNEKVKVNRRLNSLLKRTEKMQKRLKPNQKSLSLRLELNQTEIQNNIRLSQLRIQTMEENIVRRGCPGISL
jgi:predicted membrane protein